jgi:peptidoglycan/LPS O-acetylase OafA/YrhL
LSFSLFIKNFLEPLSYFVYALAFLLEYRAHRFTKEKVLFIYYVVATLVITYACFLALDYNNNNNWLYDIYYLLSALVLGYYFRTILLRKWPKKIVTLLFALITINLLVNDLIIKHLYFDSFSVAVFFLCVVISSLVYLHELLTTMS